MTGGILDTTFGGGTGIVQTAFPYSGTNSIVAQSDGRFAVAGLTSGPSAFGMARLNADGSPDTTFNATGFSTVTFGGSNESATGIVIQPDGKYVVMGVTTLAKPGGTTQHFAVARFKGDGSLDTGFGAGGLVVIDFTTDFDGGVERTDIAKAIALQSDGRIVIVGSSQSNVSGIVNAAVARIHSDGQVDSDFSADGKVHFNIGATYSAGKVASTLDAINAVAVQLDGKIVIAGHSNIQSDAEALDINDNFAVARFNFDGTLDTGFSNGIRIIDFFLTPNNGSGSSRLGDRAFSVAVQADKKIVVGGYTEFHVEGQGGQPSNQSFAVARLGADGSLDTTFTPDGLVTTDFESTFIFGSRDQANSLILQPDGAIVLSGLTNTATDGTLSADTFFGLTRYNADGTLDQNFGVHGKAVTDIPGSSGDEGRSLTFLPDGKLIVGGVSGGNLALTRYSGLELGFVQFSAASFSVNENVGSLTAIVTRTSGSDSVASVSFATSDGTAKAGTNYTATTGTLTFGIGETTKSIVVPIIDNNQFESPNKTFNITLSNPVGKVAIGSPNTALVTIIEASGGSANQSFLAQVYLDLLGRSIDPVGLSTWSAQLSSGTTREQVVLAIEQSDEFRAIEVQQLYQHYLLRAADPTGLATFTAYMAAGATIEQVAVEIIGSAEYFQNRGGGTNAGFLGALYNDALGRAIDSFGSTVFGQALLSGMTRGQVAAQILSSPEYLQLLVNSFYVSYLNRQADPSGLNNFVSLLQQGSTGQTALVISDPGGRTRPIRDEDVIAIIIGSQEYLSLLP